jgi:hypothetical protein
MRLMLLRSLIAALAIVVIPVADSKPGVNKDAQGLAIRGYDAVAYAIVGAALKGSPRIQYRYNDATWQFASVEHRDRFARGPQNYAPQFGGYCAWAVSRGYTADADPESWKIVDGKLYLLYSKSVQRRWEQDIPGNIARAQANWPSVLEK